MSLSSFEYHDNMNYISFPQTLSGPSTEYTGGRVGLWPTHVANRSRCCCCEPCLLICLHNINSTRHDSISTPPKQTQVLHETRHRKETIEYLADLKNMHKVSHIYICRSQQDVPLSSYIVQAVLQVCVIGHRQSLLISNLIRVVNADP